MLKINLGCCEPWWSIQHDSRSGSTIQGTLKYFKDRVFIKAVLSFSGEKHAESLMAKECDSTTGTIAA